MQRKRHRCPRSSPGPAFLALGREGGNGIRTPGWRRPRGRPPPLCARSPRAVGAAGRLLRDAGLSGRAGATGVGRPPGCGGCGCGCGCGSGSGSGSRRGGGPGASRGSGGAFVRRRCRPAARAGPHRPRRHGARGGSAAAAREDPRPPLPPRPGHLAAAGQCPGTPGAPMPRSAQPARPRRPGAAQLHPAARPGAAANASVGLRVSRPAPRPPGARRPRRASHVTRPPSRSGAGGGGRRWGGRSGGARPAAVLDSSSGLPLPVLALRP